MRLRRLAPASFAALGLAALLGLSGCGSKTPEADTAEVIPDPTIKVPPAATPTSPSAPTPATDPATKP